MIEFISHGRAESIAIVSGDAAEEITYDQLRERVANVANTLKRELGRGLVFLITDNSADSISLYLACLESRCPVCLLEPGIVERLEPLLNAYEPDALLVPESMEIAVRLSEHGSFKIGAYNCSLLGKHAQRRPLHPDLALLLLTSGSTGSPKAVRLTHQNLLANARSIAEYLKIMPMDRSIQSLPMHYSYGLSLVNSHLTTGATVVLTDHSFIRPEFWKVFDETGCTSFAGVPYVYETLNRLRFDPAQHASLKTMTQAGGGLQQDLIEKFYKLCNAAECRFFVMYGQTEATARISYVPHDRLADKFGSIGVAIPGGKLSLRAVKESDEQELVYQGPNVMMGYAESSGDLALGDELLGHLRTGDLARCDSDGFFYLTGRLTRLAKIFGRRISLQDVEAAFAKEYSGQVAVIERNKGLRVYVTAETQVDGSIIIRDLARRLNVPPQCVTVSIVNELPRTASGKVDYKALSS